MAAVMHTVIVAGLLGEPSGQGWKQVIELVFALVLSSLIGLEREIRQKSAGLRTQALVGVGAALFVLISKYGFTDVLANGRVILDPSRVAAQIVSGIGFLGAGVIFVRRDWVRGLTGAAVVWLTAAVGAACGAGLPVLAVVVTGAFFVISLLYTPLVHRLPRSRFALSTVYVQYLDGRGLLRTILTEVTQKGFRVAELSTAPPTGGLVELTLQVQGQGSIEELAEHLSEIDGVGSVGGEDTNVVHE
jgi:putative Mg2+ transporter-C (MgtC) family protein